LLIGSVGDVVAQLEMWWGIWWLSWEDVVAQLGDVVAQKWGCGGLQ
jgi:hypothetical protein